MIRLRLTFLFSSLVLMTAVCCSALTTTKPATKKAPINKPVKAAPKPPTNRIPEMEMISIPAGSFMMGNSGAGDDAVYASSEESPKHSVYLSAYSIGKYEVTRGQYKKFMDAGGYADSSYWSTDGWSWKLRNLRTQPAFWAASQEWTPGRSFAQTDDHPVVGVTYYEAEAFCKWAGGRLPTEAEWEKAARWTGTSSNIYPWGNTWDAEKCNNHNDHNAAGGGYQRRQTAPVGSYPTDISPYGCHDMAGNVIEWCKDWKDPKYYAQTPAGGWRNPQGPESGTHRIQRGGSWNGLDDTCRCAYRYYYLEPHLYNDNVGFRLAR